MREKLRSQLGPFARTPPSLWHLMEIEIEQDPAPLPLHDVAQLDELGAHPAESAALLLLQGRNPDRPQRFFVSIDIKIVKLIEQLAGVASIGLAFAVEHFGRYHKGLHPELAQLAMESVSKSARLLHQHHPVLACDELPGQLDQRTPAAFAAVNRPAGRCPHLQHPAMELDVERHVNHTRFGPKFFEDYRKMGNNVIFQSVGNHNASRMTPSGAVLEAYMTPTAGRSDTSLLFMKTSPLQAAVALASGGSAPSR